MSSSAASGQDKKLTFDEAAKKIANEYPNICKDASERHMLAEDFKLLVPGYENIMKRRFAEIAAYDRVKKYEAKAKAAGKPTLLELAKKDAATRTQEEVDNTDQFMQLMGANPELMKKVLGETLGKFMKDLGQK